MYVGEDDVVDAFLFKIKAGVCFHYASATVLLLRSIGIRANLVLGYAGGVIINGCRYFPPQGHSWVEVYIPKLNLWVPFDPTPPIALSTPTLNISTIIHEIMQSHIYEELTHKLRTVKPIEREPTIDNRTPYSTERNFKVNTTTTNITYNTYTAKHTTTATHIKVSSKENILYNVLSLLSLIYRYLERNMQILLLYSVPVLLITLDIKNTILWLMSKRRYRRITREVIKVLNVIKKTYNVKLYEDLTLRENIINAMKAIPSSKRRYLKAILELYEKSRFGEYPESKACREIRYYLRMLRV